MKIPRWNFIINSVWLSKTFPTSLLGDIPLLRGTFFGSFISIEISTDSILLAVPLNIGIGTGLVKSRFGLTKWAFGANREF